MAQHGINIDVRDGGTVIGSQGSSPASWLCLVRFAPVRRLPKRVRLDVVQEAGQVRVQARLDDSLVPSRFTGLVASRYQRQFDQWLEYLQGQVLPADIPEEDLDEVAAGVSSAATANGLGKYESNGATHATVRQSEATNAYEIDPRPIQNLATEDELGAATQAFGVQELASEVGSLAADERLTPGAESLQGEEAQSTAPEPVSELVSIEGNAPEPAVESSFEATVPEESAAAQNPAPASGPAAGKPEPPKMAEASRWRRFRLPWFGSRKREGSASPNDGLPERARPEAALADAAFEAESWSRAISHYDAAIQVPGTRAEPGSPESNAVSQLYFRRGVARFAQARETLNSPAQPARSVSDYQIAIEMIRQVVADYGESIRLNPGSPQGYYRRGEAHLFAARCERGSKSFRRASEHLQEAVASLTRATELRPKFAAAFGVRAIAYSLLQERDNAEADIARAEALGSDAAALRRAIDASTTW